MKIILVEDNALLRRMISEELTSHFPDDEILPFISGEDAIEEIHRSPIHIALLDINLPGMNGLEITRLLRARWPNVLIIIYTNYDSPEYRDVSFESGANHFLSKEKNKPEDLIQLILNQIN